MGEFHQFTANKSPAYMWISFNTEWISFQYEVGWENLEAKIYFFPFFSP